MQSSLKKSLYLGLAALSFVSVAAVSTNASAKSYAKAGAETDLTVSNKDTNVESTGTNALFTKPGTTKGAKVVASKATMKKLANSGKSGDYFWAYRTTTTNKGAVYYKVVSMNGKYRGYVYAGKTEGSYSRGLVKADTTTTASKPTQLNNYYIKNNDKNTLWTAPKYTEHKAKTVNLFGAATDTKFSIDKAATKTREGTLYYHVVSANGKVSGWIYNKGLTTTSPASNATKDNSVTIKYVDANYNTVGTSQVFVGTNTAAKEGIKLSADDVTALNAFADKNVPANTKVKTASAFTDSTLYGSTVQVQVTQQATSKVSFMTSPSVDGANTVPAKAISASDLIDGNFPGLTATEKEAFTDDASSTIDISKDALFLADGKLKTFNGVNTKDVNGDATHLVYTFDAATTATANANKKFGDPVVAYYTAVATPGEATPTNDSTSTDTNYVG